MNNRQNSLSMNLPWERWRLAGAYPLTAQQLAGETPALPGRSWSAPVRFRLAFGAFIFSAFFALGQESAHPLKPPDRSSPRAALKTFLDAGDALGAFLARDYLPSPSRAEFHRLISLGDAAVQSLDLSQMPPATRVKAGRAAALTLYDTLSRIQLPAADEIPTADLLNPLAGTNVARWTISNTQIVLVRAPSGPHIGEFVFSAETVAKVDEFYQRVRGLAYVRPVPLENMHEVVVLGGGWLVPSAWIQALPEWLRSPLAGQAGWKWIALVLILGLFAVLLRLAYRLSRRGSGEHPFRRALAQMTLPALILLATPAVLYLALVQLNLRGSAASIMELVATAVIYLAGAWIAWRFAPVVAEAAIASPKIPTESVDAHLIRICTRLLGIVAGAVLLAMGADRLGLPVYGIVAGLGVGGLAIALAAQPTVENLIGGLSLFADKSIRVGDFCRCGTDEGTVETIGIRSTWMRGTDRTLTTIPNAALSKMPVVNFGRRDEMLIQSTIGVRYETSPEQLRYLLVKIRELLVGHPRIEPDSARARLVGFGASSLDIEVFAYVKTKERPEFLGIREDVLLRVMDIVEQSGTGFAFPSQTLYFGRDHGLDPKRTEAAEAQVRQWRDEGRLPFPNFPPEQIRALRESFSDPSPGPNSDHLQSKTEMNQTMNKLFPACLGIALGAMTTQAADSLDRTVLPIQFPKQPVLKELYAKDVKTIPPRQEVKAPAQAPNVVVILIDDLGFGATETFGGPLKTPTMDRLAKGGLRYNSFHTTALCSPTRVALKSGRNHHTANMGFITELATGLPGATGEVPNRVAPLAEILRLNGYSTAAFGKWHETAVWETSVSGPFDRWPTQQGFDKFYGFIGGEANQWAPYLHDGVAQVEIPNDPNYHLNTDMANQAMAWLKFQKAMTPDKPLFIYYAPGAVHAPHHVPKDWIAKWKGKFDGGWDKLREETLARQLKLGIVPPGTKRAPKPAAIKDWDKLTADEKRLFARQAEVFAAFVEHTDYEIGRVVDGLNEIGQLDNTLIFYIAGDNGTSAEGGQNGMFNEMTYFNGVTEKLEDMVKLMDKWGGPETYPHMAAGWAVALDTPFQWTKQVASDFGGTRVGMVAHWPKGIKAKNEIRPHFSHVIDIAPTVLEAAGLPEPKVVKGTPQMPMEGKSLVYTFDNATAKERHTTQYFEIAGNRAIYHEGWFARTIHKAAWEGKPRRALEQDIWELFDTRSDFSLANDLAAANPKKLKQLQAVFLKEAAKYQVLPIDDRVFERLNGEAVGRPDLMGARTSITVAEGMSGMMESTFINVKNKSKTITADIVVPEKGAHGIILAQAGRFGGWALYARDGVPAYDYNFLGLKSTTIAGGQPLATGKHTLRFDFAYDGGGPGKGGLGTLFVDNAKVAEGRIEHTQGGWFSADETTDVGIDLGTPVVEAIGAEAKSRFTGRIPKVTVEVK